MVNISNMAIHIKINDIQIDNQLQIATFQTNLYPIVPKAARNDIRMKRFSFFFSFLIFIF